MGHLRKDRTGGGPHQLFLWGCSRRGSRVERPESGRTGRPGWSRRYLSLRCSLRSPPSPWQASVNKRPAHHRSDTIPSHRHAEVPPRGGVGEKGRVPVVLGGQAGRSPCQVFGGQSPDGGLDQKGPPPPLLPAVRRLAPLLPAVASAKIPSAPPPHKVVSANHTPASAPPRLWTSTEPVSHPGGGWPVGETDRPPPLSSFWTPEPDRGWHCQVVRGA